MRMILASKSRTCSEAASWAGQSQTEKPIDSILVKTEKHAIFAWLQNWADWRLDWSQNWPRLPVVDFVRDQPIWNWLEAALTDYVTGGRTKTSLKVWFSPDSLRIIGTGSSWNIRRIVGALFSCWILDEIIKPGCTELPQLESSD